MTLILQKNVLKKNWPQPLLLAWPISAKALTSASVARKFQKGDVWLFPVFRAALPSLSRLY